MSNDFAAFIFEITALCIGIVYTRSAPNALANFHCKIFEIYEINMYSYLWIVTIHRATRQ